jgi:hypothetical protein
MTYDTIAIVGYSIDMNIQHGILPGIGLALIAAIEKTSCMVQKEYWLHPLPVYLLDLHPKTQLLPHTFATGLVRT